MNLTEYLKSTGQKPYKFADSIPISRPVVYEVLKLERGTGARKILLESALKIREASGGVIDLEALGQPPGP